MLKKVCLFVSKFDLLIANLVVIDVKRFDFVAVIAASYIETDVNFRDVLAVELNTMPTCLIAFDTKL